MRSLHFSDNDSEEVDALLKSFNLFEFADVPVAKLSYGQKKILEIATTQVFKPRLLLLDEPLAGVGLSEVTRIKDIILSLSKDNILLMIDHNMHFIKELCEKIFVLHQGKIICEGSFEELSSDPQVMEAYLGDNNNGR